MRRVNTSGATISSGATADIAFLLLIFFMVVTSFYQSQGITMKLPPQSHLPPKQLNENQVLTLMLNGENELMVEKKPLKIELLNSELDLEIATRQQKGPVIFNLIIHENSDYNHYLKTLSCIKYSIRNHKIKMAMEQFGKEWAALSTKEYESIKLNFSYKIFENHFNS